MSGKRYPEEFKIEAVKQVVYRGHSVSSVAISHSYINLLTANILPVIMPLAHGLRC